MDEFPEESMTQTLQASSNTISDTLHSRYEISSKEESKNTAETSQVNSDHNGGTEDKDVEV